MLLWKKAGRLTDMSKGVILVTPRGYAAYGAQAAKRLEALGYEMNINTTGKPLSREAFVEYAKKAPVSSLVWMSWMANC